MSLLSAPGETAAGRRSTRLKDTESIRGGRYWGDFTDFGDSAREGACGGRQVPGRGRGYIKEQPGLGCLGCFCVRNDVVDPDAFFEENEANGTFDDVD